MDKLENKIRHFNKDLAKILAACAYHIAPEIVGYISARNKEDYSFFKDLFADKIDIENYLFPGSACVFPGIRRWDSEKGEKHKYDAKHRAIIDDNAFPRHIWCFLYNGQCSSGPNWKNFTEFELAHIFAHKEFELETERKFFKEIKHKFSPCGEFTSAGNVVLLPKGIVRPTDNSPEIKSVFYKRYIELYGEETLSGRGGFKHDSVPDWYSEIEWNTPYFPGDWKRKIDKLLDYRKQRIVTLLQNAGIVSSRLGPGLTPPPPPSGGKISKSQAMAMVNQKHGLNLNDSNTMFSSINAAVKQWSFNRENNHFNDDTHMILNDQEERKLHYFFMKGGAIKEPDKKFNQRPSKPNTSIIIIPASFYNFKESFSGFSFGDYKKDTIKY